MSGDLVVNLYRYKLHGCPYYYVRAVSFRAALEKAGIKDESHLMKIEKVASTTPLNDAVGLLVGETSHDEQD